MRDVFGWLSQQADRFIPASLQTADEQRRARLIIGFSFCAIIPTLIFFLLALVNYPPLIAVSTGAGVIYLVLTPVILRRTGSLNLATAMLLSCTVVSTAVTVLTEGLTSAALPWFGVLPLLASTFAARRAGLLCALACFGAVVALVLLDVAGVQGHEQSLAVRRISNVANSVLLLVTVLVFVLLYESLRRQAMAALTQANAELAATREESIRTERLASLGRMAAGVAHEINNPMTFISGNLALLHDDLRDGPLDPSLQREYVDDVLPATADGIRRVIAIVNDLRRFARGDVEARVEFDLNQEVATALRLCEARLQDCHTDVKLGALPSMVGLPRQLAQVTMNLVINAAQAVARGGRILVETEAVGDEIVLRVSDDGMGMSPAVQARLFEPFFTSKPAGEGTGLGLSVVHGIVEAHGGVVRVTSREREGSTFEVRLPLRPPVAIAA